jgi:hypothetical protein
MSTLKKQILFLILILTIALIIRTSGVLTQNVLFLFDSARDLLYVKKIVVDHDIILIGPSSGGLQGYYHGVLWYYFLVIPFVLGSGNPLAFTIFAALCSTASISLIYFLFKKISLKTAIIATTFYAFAAFSVNTSKFIWNPYPIIWLMPIYFFCLYQTVISKKNRLPIIALVTALFIHFEAIYGVVLIPTLIFLIIHQLKKPGKSKLKTIVISFILFLLPFLPYALFDLRHDFQISKSLFETVKSGGANITHRSEDLVESPIRRITLRLDDLYTYTIGSLTPVPAINILLAVICAFEIYKMKQEKKKDHLLFVSIILTTLFIPFLFFINLKYSVWSYYWIGNPPLFALLTAFLLAQAFQRIKIENTNRALYALVIILLISYNPIKPLTTWYTGTIGAGTQTLSTQLSIVEKIYTDTNKTNFSVYVLTPPVYDYVYRYLLWWKGTTQYKHLPSDTKQQNIYLILEPSASDPTGEYFKKNVVKTEQGPTSIFNFPANIKLEKIIKAPNEPAFDSTFLPQL